MKKLAVTLFILFGVVEGVYAQGNPVCPPDMLLAFARSGSACFSLERNEACIGNGTVESQLYPSDAQATPFVQPGDIMDAGLLHDVHTEVIDKGISTVMLYTQANLTDAEQHSVALFLFGDTTVENEVAPLPEMTAYAKGGLNIRATPEDNGTILASLAVNKAVIANGRTQAGDWLRVHVPNSNALGWVAANVVKLDSNLLNLAVVDVTTPVFRPFQIFKLTTGDATSCGGALPSGLLLESPSSTTAKVTINGADLEISGAVFLQVKDALTMDVLNGEATISFNGNDVYVPAGARTQVPLGSDGTANGAAAQPEPYDLPSLQALPINNVPYRMQLAAALTTDQIAQKTAEHDAALAEATAEAPIAAVDNTCKRIVKRDTTLWGGPGSFYEAVENIKVGTAVSPVLETTDPDGKVWWQLDNNNWIEGDLVIQSGICHDIPVVANVPAPEYNELTLETCETSNGPLRAGQDVEIHFLPPAFDSLEDAQNAPNVDPGSITIGTQYFYTYASDPIYIGKVGDTKRYVVEFETYWTATPGTFRIVGDRLHYTPICTVTVPVG